MFSDWPAKQPAGRPGQGILIPLKLYFRGDAPGGAAMANPPACAKKKMAHF
jgi:hypothetical protein